MSRSVQAALALKALEKDKSAPAGVASLAQLTAVAKANKAAKALEASAEDFDEEFVEDDDLIEDDFDMTQAEEAAEALRALEEEHAESDQAYNDFERNSGSTGGNTVSKAVIKIVVEGGQITIE